MDLKLTFLGRGASRWRVRVELPVGPRPRGLTIGLWGEDGVPLGPAVVAPANTPRVWEAELAGPLQLPPGTQVRCIADLEGGPPEEVWLGVDRRRGLHAFLHADGWLPVTSTCAGVALGSSEIRRLAEAFPWMLPDPAVADAAVAPADLGAVAAGTEALPVGLRELLAEEFGVDVEALDEETLAFMKA